MQRLLEPLIPKKTLSGITVTGPNKTAYIVGESFMAAGLVITARYSDNSSKEVSNYIVNIHSTSLIGYKFTAADAGTKTVTVSYTEKGITKSTVFAITVVDLSGLGSLLGITIISEPAKKTYYAGETFSSIGLVVKAEYEKDPNFDVSDLVSLFMGVTNLIGHQFVAADVGYKTVTVSHTDGGVTKTASFTITVEASAAQSYPITKGTVGVGGDITVPAVGIVGSTITINGVPLAGYALATVTVTATSANIATAGTGNTRTFVMPDSPVTIDATFTEGLVIDDFTTIFSGSSGQIYADGRISNNGMWWTGMVNGATATNIVNNTGQSAPNSNGDANAFSFTPEAYNTDPAEAKAGRYYNNVIDITNYGKLSFWYCTNARNAKVDALELVFIFNNGGIYSTGGAATPNSGTFYDVGKFGVENFAAVNVYSKIVFDLAAVKSLPGFDPTQVKGWAIKIVDKTGLDAGNADRYRMYIDNIVAYTGD